MIAESEAWSSYPVLETISLRILTASSLLMFSKFTSFTCWRENAIRSWPKIKFHTLLQLTYKHINIYDSYSSDEIHRLILHLIIPE